MKAKLISILERYGKSLEDKLESSPIHRFLCSCHFKILPKVHKRPLVGRPIVVSTKYLTTPASHFVDYILSPCLPSLPSYLKDSSDLIRDLSDFGLVPGSHLVTADDTSLYTNIPIADCITAVDLFCRSNSCTCTALITELTIFVLTNNYFETEGTKDGVWPPLAVSAAVIYTARRYIAIN